MVSEAEINYTEHHEAWHGVQRWLRQNYPRNGQTSQLIGGITWDLQDGSFLQASSSKATTSVMTYAEAEVTYGMVTEINS